MLIILTRSQTFGEKQGSNRPLLLHAWDLSELVSILLSSKHSVIFDKSLPLTGSHFPVMNGSRPGNFLESTCLLWLSRCLRFHQVRGWHSCLGQGHMCLWRTLLLPSGDSLDPFLEPHLPNPKFLDCWFPRCWHPKLELTSRRKGGEGLRGQAGKLTAWLPPCLCHVAAV